MNTTSRSKKPIFPRPLGRKEKSKRALPSTPREQSPSRASRDRQRDAYWRRWPDPEDWPGRLSLAEACAYLYVSADFLYDATEPARDGRAVLPAQHLAAKGARKTLRFRKADLDAFQLIPGRHNTQEANQP